MEQLIAHHINKTKQNYGWVGTMISNLFPKNGVPSSGKDGWVDPSWDKVLNFTGF